MQIWMQFVNQNAQTQIIFITLLMRAAARVLNLTPQMSSILCHLKSSVTPGVKNGQRIGKGKYLIKM